MNAYHKIVSYGWDTTNAPVIYDLEAFNTTNAGCLTAVKSFINGWVQQLHVAPGQKAGLYGSTCGSHLAAFAGIAHAPTSSPAPPGTATGARTTCRASGATSGTTASGTSSSGAGTTKPGTA